MWRGKVLVFTLVLVLSLGLLHSTSKAIAVPTTVNGFTTGPSSNDWTMFHHDLTHTGYSTSTAPKTNNTLWKYATGGIVFSSPAVSGGRIYIGSEDNNIYCFNASTGAKLWNFTTGSAMDSSPAVSGGRVYTGSDRGNVYCLSASTGNLLWNYTTGGAVFSSPAVANGMVYVGSEDNYVYCLNATNGSLIWRYQTGGWVDSSPAVANGMVYVGSYDDCIYCLNATSGTLIWSYTTGDVVVSSPAVFNGMVYIDSYDNNVYCLNATSGAEIWSYTTGNTLDSSPAVANGMVYVGSYDDCVYCLNATNGNEIWSYLTGNSVESSPAVVNSMVYVGSDDGNVYCLNATSGSLIWSYTTGNVVLSSPAIVNGIVYVGSFDGNVYAFGTPLNLNLQAEDWSGNILAGATVYINNGTAYSKAVNVNGWANFTGITASSVAVSVKWQNSWVDGTFSVTMTSSQTVYVKCKVYSLSFAFKDNAGITAINPATWQVEAPNGTILTVTGSFPQAQNGTWTITQILWQGNDVVPVVHPTVSLGSNYAWTVSARVYNVNQWAFKNSAGTSILAVTSFQLKYPNGTISRALSPSSSLYIQNGTSTLVSVYWEGNNIIPLIHPTFDATNGNPVFDCNVYPLSFTFKDNSGGLTINPTNWGIKAPNGTICTIVGNIPQAQNGTWAMTRILWQGNDVIPSSQPTNSLTSNYAWTVDCRVYAVNFVGAFKDSSENALYVNPSSFQLNFPNSTTISLTVGSYYVQ
ncbi:MAG TPA: PQQ-binding-like beta-propeller repeat protein, partial [archaeon]|nr:PQQ-binding-like beta-propeller repeat protein [archaeon]